MYIATICFLGLAAGVTILLACRSVREQAKTLNRTPCRQRKSEQYDASTWDAIKVAWSDWHSYHPEKRSVAQVLMFSWGRTFALCAALCVIGMFLEVQVGRAMSIDEIVTDLAEISLSPAALPAPDQ
jgi:hypothetical protein